MSTPRHRTAFLFDVDNTLLDNDQIIVELQRHLDQEVGADRAAHYWEIFEKTRTELGYADYLGALQLYRGQYPHDAGVLTVSRFLLGYPFADRLFPRAYDVIEHVARWGPAAILTDGDVVFQPRKIDRAGLSDAMDGRVYIYLHKEQELDDVETRLPADHYVLVEDKLRVLTAVKHHWGSKVTTVFVRQGHYASDAKILAEYPPADITIDHVGDLLHYTLAELRPVE
jgi:phosphoglycolate phosphatase-like HAD superfamily hydrolase